MSDAACVVVVVAAVVAGVTVPCASCDWSVSLGADSGNGAATGACSVVGWFSAFPSVSCCSLLWSSGG